MAGDDVAQNAVETAARTRASSAAIDCSKASAATAFMNTPALRVAQIQAKHV